ncbi:group II intron reverse transcriptase/maturase, partial [Salmonella enterica subsp. enterica serovar Typhimurium]
MPKNKNEALCVEDLRHDEYYEMQNPFDDLYDKSKNGDIFTHLIDIILSRENILLAYRNNKANAGSKTAG